MELSIFFIVTIIASVFLIRKEANYILEMGLNGGVTLSLIILAVIVICLGGITSLYFIFDFFDPNPYYCEFCDK